ncbi:ATP-binding protein [Candidatus Protofrankia californiensis]|uniref:ATP-binding protein n=1 Tax=Candidatus Protofrankia californiensis TaxID=1839754 RepID=UPI0019D0EBD1|nr:ATP-binding protein [Candidatus Protofrankia californiensis]
MVDLRRSCDTIAEEYLSVFRVVILNGPRQSGKTTLLRHMRDRHGGTLLNLDDEQTLQAATSDPVAFTGSGSEPRFIDEVQRGGDALVRAVKAEVDAAPRPGRYVLAGSTRFLTTPSLSESLAGRAGVVNVWPFSQGEFDGRADNFIDRAFDDPGSLITCPPSVSDRNDYFQRICRGGFPEPALMKTIRARRAWFRGYVEAIAERDIREMTRINEPSSIRTLLAYLASVTAQEHNTANTANKTGLHRTTITRYLELLETVFLIHRLPAWSRNLTARVVKHPKLHLTDTGLAAALLGVSPEALARPVAPSRGPLIETFIVNELAKQATWSDSSVRLHHWRVSGGAEVDIVLERDDGQIVAIECKAADTVTGDDFRGLAVLHDLLGPQFVHGIVLHTGRQGALRFGDRMVSLPIAALWETTPRPPGSLPG